MNKKPFLLRSFFALVVVVVFVASMFPLTQSDFYKTLEGLVENPENPELQAVIADARALQKQDEVMYESAAKALEEAAEKRGVSLIQHVKPLIVKSQKLINNSDVISLVRKNAAGSIRLGIDLNGGAEFMLLLEPQDKNVSYDRLQFDRFRDTAIETLRKRLESQNIFETEISPSGQNLVSMRVPLVTKEEKANLEKLISMTAQLQFKLVHPNSDAEVERYLQDPDSYTPPEGSGSGGSVTLGVGAYCRMSDRCVSAGRLSAMKSSTRRASSTQAGSTRWRISSPRTAMPSPSSRSVPTCRYIS